MSNSTHQDQTEKETEPQGGTIKKFLYINRRLPHGTVYAHESLEVVLIGAAFDQDVSMLFIDDGVYQLKKDQNPNTLEFKNFSKTYAALEMYDVEKIFVEQESLEERGLSVDDLLVKVKLIRSADVKSIVDQNDVILSY